MNSKHTAPPQQDVQPTEPDATRPDEVKETPDDNTAAGTEETATEKKEAVVKKEAGMAQLILPPLLMNFVAYSVVYGILLILPSLLMNIIAYAIVLDFPLLGKTFFSLTDQFLVYAVFFVHIILSLIGLYIWYSKFYIVDDKTTLCVKLSFKAFLAGLTALGIYLSLFTVTPSHSSNILGIRLFLFFMVPNLGLSLALIDHFEKINRL